VAKTTEFSEVPIRPAEEIFDDGDFAMFCNSIASVKNLSTTVIARTTVLLALFGGVAFAAQDRYSLKIPDGLSWSEFRGYETWQDVAVSQTETSLKVIAANDVMMNAYRDGVPGNGKPFPDGSKVTKIEWSFKKNTASPYFVNVPDTLKTVAFIEKDTKRFPNTHGWAYAQWAYDPATDTFSPSQLDPSGAECGFACHTKVSAQDYIFTAYPKR
jgi:Cytochrome P460